MPALGRVFYTVAGLSGVGFGVVAVAVPVHVAALHRPASLAGELLACVTLAVAVGALGAGSAARRVRGARNLLAGSFVVSALGQAVLLATDDTVAMMLGAVLSGIGIGFFWVSSQTLLGRVSGAADSERGFAHHYAAYTLGVAAGSAAVGGASAVLLRAGVGEGASIQFSYAVGLAAMLTALVLWPPRKQPDRAIASHSSARPRPTPHSFAMQLPDLLLVSALALMLPLAPVVLMRDFHLAPVLVGVTVALVQAGKVGGTFAGRAITRDRGHRRAILLLLGSGALLSLLLALSIHLAGAPLFALALVATAFVATGAWPLIVDSALARTEPSRRPSATVTWNVFEYGTIAAVTSASGWLLASLHSPMVLFALGSAMLAAAAVAAGVVLRWPVHVPDVSQAEAL